MQNNKPNDVGYVLGNGLVEIEIENTMMVLPMDVTAYIRKLM